MSERREKYGEEAEHEPPTDVWLEACHRRAVDPPADQDAPTAADVRRLVAEVRRLRAEISKRDQLRQRIIEELKKSIIASVELQRWGG